MADFITSERNCRAIDPADARIVVCDWIPLLQLVARIELSMYKWQSGDAFRVGCLLCYAALAFGAIHDQN